MLKPEPGIGLASLVKPGQVVTDLARPEDREAILALNRLEYGPADILANETDFAWRWEQNPAGPAVVPILRDPEHTVISVLSYDADNNPSLSIQEDNGRMETFACTPRIICHKRHSANVYESRCSRKMFFAAPAGNQKCCTEVLCISAY